ncbi:MAG: acetate kinase [Oscillospiraceae bacterium]|jgi:acetate kinase|nr:acetate kinase [Oscillospiraceae bacterium]
MGGKITVNILVINAGSSSLKYQLFDMTKRVSLARGLCERIGIGGRVKHYAEGRADYVSDRAMADHGDAIRAVTELLTGPDTGVIASMKDISAVGHRVLHGGQRFSGSIRITGAVIDAIEECVPLGPLHNPPNLVGIRACAQVMKDVPQVAVFDTAFHQTMPPEAYMYALPYEYYEKYHVRRYGFHGTSHRYVSARAAAMLSDRDPAALKVVTCHLGNGSSLAAVKGGKCVDTSMGLTPLEGVPMGTRSGSIDPAILAYVGEREGLGLAEITDVLNKKSGMLGLSGVSSDFRDLHAAADSGDKRAQLALDVFAYAVKKHIGMFAAAMNGVDALVFTGGVGENNIPMRRWIAGSLTCLGLELDDAKNDLRADGERDISTPRSPGRILVIPTNEELVIAEDTEAIVKG